MKSVKGRGMLFSGTFVSIKSSASIMGKFRDLGIYNWRRTLEEIDHSQNPIIRRMIIYLHKVRGQTIREVWNQLSHRLFIWVKWEKGLHKMEAGRSLNFR